MRVLITGACGFVGKVLAKSLLEHHDAQQFEIIGLDNLSRAGSWVNRKPLLDRGVHLIHGDVRMASDLDAVGDVDWIIDASANPSVLAGVNGKSSSRQLVEHNLQGTINLLEYCRRYEAGFTLLSTSRVYSIPELAALPVQVESGAYRIEQDAKLPTGISTAGISENYSISPPVSLYGSTKVCSEHLALEYGTAFGFPVRINRCGVLAGAGQFGKADQGIFSFWLHSWHAKRPLKYIGFEGMGHQVRDCLHPRDLLPLVLAQMAEKDAKVPSVVNVSGGLESSRSLRQLSEWCADRWGQHPVDSAGESRPFDLPWVVLDHAAVTEAWEWQPQTSTEVILDEIARHAEKNPDWIDFSA